MRQPGNFDAQAFKTFRNIMRGSLAIDGGVQGEDDLSDTTLLHAINEHPDGQIIGAHAIERAHNAAEDMITAAKCGRSFERPEVRHILNHANEPIITASRLAHSTGLKRVIIPADLALFDFVCSLSQSFGHRAQKRILTL